MLENILQKIWYSKNTLYKFLSILLLPLSFLYLVIFYIKRTLTLENEFDTPIICFGNINVGGTGKSSTLLSLLTELIKVKPKLVILLRGYKGKIKYTHKVDPSYDTALTVGDEALIYANSFKTFISSNRPAAIKDIIDSENPDLIVLDDGFQDKRVKKNKNIILINGNRGLGNSLLLPSGPLREIPSLAFKKTDIIILVGEDHTNFKFKYKNQINQIDLFKGKIVTINNGKDKNFLAFSGIGNNDSFFDTLEKNNYNILKKLAFPDHYQYSRQDIEKIINTSQRNGLIPITTEKDMIRIPPNLQNQIKYLKIKIEIEDEGKLIKRILEF